jgi:hypothetical protein
MVVTTMVVMRVGHREAGVEQATGQFGYGWTFDPRLDLDLGSGSTLAA